jgi:hypothetical protein
MRAAGDSPEGVRLRGIIVVLWRAGLRISEALALSESDLDQAVVRSSSATARAAYVEFDIGGPMLCRELCCAGSMEARGLSLKRAVG